MKMIVGLSIFCFFLSVISGATQNCTCPDDCPKRCPRYPGDGWIQFRDSCYLFRDKLSVLQYISQHDCFIHMSKALEINDKAEDEFIRSTLNKLFKYPTNMNASVWTGAAFLLHSNTWEWDSEKMKFTNWYPGQPRGIGPNDTGLFAFEHHCLALVGEHNFTWHDVPCNTYLHSVCEISLNSPDAHFG